MDYPPLVKYSTTAEYRAHFESRYCRKRIRTFDGIAVRFRRRDFDHCFFESSKRDGQKDHFSVPRAERIDWIAACLQDPDAELYVGYDRRRKRRTRRRRVALVQGDYVVVIAITGKNQADFVTAFVADTAPTGPRMLSTIDKIRMGPKWPIKNR